MPIGPNGERLPYNMPFEQKDMDLAQQMLGTAKPKRGPGVPSGLNMQNMVQFARTPAGKNLIRSLGNRSR
jgi:hypothetical protein